MLGRQSDLGWGLVFSRLRDGGGGAPTDHFLNNGWMCWDGDAGPRRPFTRTAPVRARPPPPLQMCTGVIDYRTPEGLDILSRVLELTAPHAGHQVIAQRCAPLVLVLTSPPGTRFSFLPSQGSNPRPEDL